MRQNGYYRVKTPSLTWEIAKWNGENWLCVGIDNVYSKISDTDFSWIDSEPIDPEPISRYKNGRPGDYDIKLYKEAPPDGSSKPLVLPEYTILSAISRTHVMWELDNGFFKNGDHICLLYDILRGIELSQMQIWSVKRKDGEVFTVGDYVYEFGDIVGFKIDPTFSNGIAATFGKFGKIVSETTIGRLPYAYSPPKIEPDPEYTIIAYKGIYRRNVYFMEIWELQSNMTWQSCGSNISRGMMQKMIEEELVEIHTVKRKDGILFKVWDLVTIKGMEDIIQLIWLISISKTTNDLKICLTNGLVSVISNISPYKLP